MKSRREKAFFVIGKSLNMRCPALLVLAPPHLHRFQIALDSSVFPSEMQFAVDLPCDVRKLKHRNRDPANRDWGVELLSFADCRDEIRKVGISDGIAAQQIGGFSRSASLEFVRLIPFEVVYFVAIAVDQHRASGSHDRRSTIASVILHSLAAFALPRNHCVFVLEVCYQSVVK